MSNKNTDKEKRVTMKKGRYSPVKVNSNEAPHPPRRQGKKGPSPEMAMVGAFIDRKGNPQKHLFAAVPELIEKTNSIQTVAGWMAWDQFRNEETRIDFIIDTLTTQSKWQQRGRVVHMGWHIPDILLILNKEGFCSSKQILQIVKGFEGVTISNKIDWKNTTKKLKGKLPDEIKVIKVDGPVKFDMEFATFVPERGEERCYIGNAAYGDEPSLMQWFRPKNGEQMFTTGENPKPLGTPKWVRYSPHVLDDSGEYTLTPKAKRLKAEAVSKAKRYAERQKKAVAANARQPSISDQIEQLKNGNSVVLG